MDSQQLRQAFLNLKAEKSLRQRDAALALGVSEGEIVAASVSASDGPVAVRLRGDGFPALFKQVETLGPVMALTRNESVVHEKTGPYVKLIHEDHAGP